MIPIDREGLPSPAKKLPILGQEMFLRVYNRTIKTAPRRKATEVAWSVIRQFYKKNSKGKWMKRP